MRVLLINSVCGIRSTGRICTDIADKLSAEGHEVKIAYGREVVPEKHRKYAVKIGSNIDQKLHGVRTRLLDEHGFGSKRATEKFLKWADEFNPDMVWLHNIHGYYINIELLFAWIKKRPDMQVKWTLHDCWAFTGHCSYFTMVKCEQWKSHCSYCSQKARYPSSILKDNCENNFDRKKAAFTGVKNMALITPSQWLADLVKHSFLSEYPVEVHYNTIDTTVFKPTPSDFREKYGLQDKKIILGVASVWDERKGLDDFMKLATVLDDRYAIVLVGLTEKQIKGLSKRITAIGRTNSTQQLAEIYSAADIFVNPSKEETFGLTTIEAQACGTPAIVYKDTACEEIVEKHGGLAVEQNVEALKVAIEAHPYFAGGVEFLLIQRTNNSLELAAIYTAADVFFNPTYEDNYPTVNLEAEACGTPVVTYRTGGAPETIHRQDSVAITVGDVANFWQRIVQIANETTLMIK